MIRRVFRADDRNPIVTIDDIRTKCKPHGIIEDRFYDCTAGGASKRRMLVYLPADYYSSDKRYPVVYLLHGARGNESSWIDRGNMISLVDSLMKYNKMKPCIIVMPNMNNYNTDEEGLNSTFKAPIQSLFDVDGSTESAFVHDVVGFVDSHYRSIPDKRHRAIAGLSIGSFQTIYITAANPDTFDYIGAFSPIFKSPVKKSQYSEFYDFSDVKAKQAVQFDKNHCPQLYLVMVGRNDFYIFHAEGFRQYLSFNNYPHEFIETRGGHNWDNWYNYLRLFLTFCFD